MPGHRWRSSAPAPSSNSSHERTTPSYPHDGYSPNSWVHPASWPVFTRPGLPGCMSSPAIVPRPVGPDRRIARKTVSKPATPYDIAVEAVSPVAAVGGVTATHGRPSTSEGTPSQHVLGCLWHT